MGPFLAGMVADGLRAMSDIHPIYHAVTIASLRDFVKSGRITEQQFIDLTGLLY